MKNQWDEYGNFLGKIPKQCVKDCSHSGQCLDDVENWVNKLNFSVPSDMARKYLQSFGTWDDLETCSQKDLNRRVLWLACCEIKEEGRWIGLME